MKITKYIIPVLFAGFAVISCDTVQKTLETVNTVNDALGGDSTKTAPALTNV